MNEYNEQCSDDDVVEVNEMNEDANSQIETSSPENNESQWVDYLISKHNVINKIIFYKLLFVRM